MEPLSKVLRAGADGALYFWCLGCDMPHCVMHGAGGGPRWAWNGDAERPTLTPSVLVRGTVPLTKDQHAAWMAGAPLPAPVPLVCHTFVTDGRIQYLGDCTHCLVNQTVGLPEWPEGW